MSGRWNACHKIIGASKLAPTPAELPAPFRGKATCLTIVRSHCCLAIKTQSSALTQVLGQTSGMTLCNYSRSISARRIISGPAQISSDSIKWVPAYACRLEGAKIVPSRISETLHWLAANAFKFGPVRMGLQAGRSSFNFRGKEIEYGCEVFILVTLA